MHHQRVTRRLRRTKGNASAALVSLPKVKVLEPDYHYLDAYWQSYPRVAMPCSLASAPVVG